MLVKGMITWYFIFSSLHSQLVMYIAWFTAHHSKEGVSLRDGGREGRKEENNN